MLTLSQHFHFLVWPRTKPQHQTIQIRAGFFLNDCSSSVLGSSMLSPYCSDTPECIGEVVLMPPKKLHLGT